MRLCVPATSGDDRTARVSGHFGRAPYFAFIDTETGAVEMVENPGHDHAHPPDFVIGRGLDALAARGMGRGAFTRFQAAGVALYVTDAADVAGTLEAFRAGSLRPMGEGDVHAGGHHGHHHGPGHQHAH